MDEGSVCVLIPSVRNSDELAVVLQGLSKQDFDGKLEIVVVGPGNDPGKRVAESLGARFIDDGGVRTRADACNVGLEKTESEFVFFTDDDVIVPENWISSLIKWFERPEVAGVGGPNFAPVKDSTFWQRVIDVTFCSKWVTAGTNYGNQAMDELEEVEQLPGVNAAYRRSVLEEVNGFDHGAIGCEDAMLDYRIRKAGHKLWQDGSAIMWHRRRGPSRVRKQIGNYGMVRILASNIHPEMRSWTHSAVGLFPLLSFIGISALITGAIGGGADASFWFTFDGIWSPSRILFHGSLGLMSLYIAMCWVGALFGTSPSRSLFTILAAPLMTFTLHWSYGIGVMRGWQRIRSGNPGLQIDDRNRI
ncbi:MAG: glycosyltransferase [Candidatus Thalassarchaeaceae archaeon]|jgi:GT2 family glycosyltransferase|nr:glycosyltransferase [Candidatus Thalassarchaeaceae archaeon]